MLFFRKIALLIVATLAGCATPPSEPPELVVEKVVVEPAVVKTKVVRLTINSEPNSTISIMNVGPPYQPGIYLMKGEYDIKISKPGYFTYRHWHQIDDHTTLEIALEKDPTYIGPGIRQTTVVREFNQQEYFLSYEDSSGFVWAIKKADANTGNSASNGFILASIKPLTSMVKKALNQKETIVQRRTEAPIKLATKEKQPSFLQRLIFPKEERKVLLIQGNVETEAEQFPSSGFTQIFVNGETQLGSTKNIIQPKHASPLTEAAKVDYSAEDIGAIPLFLANKPEDEVQAITYGLLLPKIKLARLTTQVTIRKFEWMGTDKPPQLAVVEDNKYVITTNIIKKIELAANETAEQIIKQVFGNPSLSNIEFDAQSQVYIIQL